jgi:hypothetical protein
MCTALATVAPERVLREVILLRDHHGLVGDDRVKAFESRATISLQ